MIVVDSNVLAYSLIQGEKTSLARRARELDPQWRFPTLWRHELLNILSNYARFRGANPKRLQSLWKRSVFLFFPGERAIDLTAALQLSIRHKVSAYDVQFIVLAQSLQVACLPEDEALRRAFPKDTVSLEEFCKR